MASLSRGPPPMLKSERRPSQNIVPQASDVLPEHATKTRGVGDTPMNTPANPPIAIAPRLAGGRPIGRSGNAPHAATPGNTPSSLETMGRRIAGKLQGGPGPVGANSGGNAAATGVGPPRIAPSYERRFTAGLNDIGQRLATNQEQAVPADSPSSSMQRLQIVSPASTEHGKKAEWPTSFDTDTRGSEPADKESKGEKKAE